MLFVRVTVGEEEGREQLLAPLKPVLWSRLLPTLKIWISWLILEFCRFQWKSDSRGTQISTRFIAKGKNTN